MACGGGGVKEAGKFPMPTLARLANQGIRQASRWWTFGGWSSCTTDGLARTRMQTYGQHDAKHNETKRNAIDGRIWGANSQRRVGCSQSTKYEKQTRDAYVCGVVPSREDRQQRHDITGTRQEAATGKMVGFLYTVAVNQDLVGRDANGTDRVPNPESKTLSGQATRRAR